MEVPYEGPSAQTLRELPLNSSSSAAILALSDSPDQDVNLSHAALRACCVRLSAALLSRPLASGAVVAIVVPNSPDFVIAFLAVTALRAVAAPLNPAYTADEFKFYLSDANVALVILPRDAAQDSAAARAADLLGIPVLRLPADLLQGVGGPVEYPDVVDFVPRADDVALFLHTSGTTSRPKGVPLTHENLCKSIGTCANVRTDRPRPVAPRDAAVPRAWADVGDAGDAGDWRGCSIPAGREILGVTVLAVGRARRCDVVHGGADNPPGSCRARGRRVPKVQPPTIAVCEVVLGFACARGAAAYGEDVRGGGAGGVRR